MIQTLQNVKLLVRKTKFYQELSGKSGDFE